MEQDKNNMDFMNNMTCFGMDNMPPYMYGKCMNMVNMPYNNKYMSCMNNNIAPNYSLRGDIYTAPYMMKNLEPIENMYGNTYKILIVYVRKVMQTIIIDNMGIIPRSISKDGLKKYINDMMCDALKNYDEIKSVMAIEKEDEEESDRKICPYCSSMLKDTLAILLIAELLRGGCTSCY